MKKIIDVCDLCGEERLTLPNTQYTGCYNPFCAISGVWSNEWNDANVGRAISLVGQGPINDLFNVNEKLPREGMSVIATIYPSENCEVALARFTNNQFMSGEQVIDAECWEQVQLVEEL